jgi:hypothetical protein
MKTVSFVVGVFAIVTGLLWIGQGAGLVRLFPSFMIDQPIWIMWGVLIAAVGGALLMIARRG